MGWGHIPVDGMCMKFIIACSAELATSGPSAPWVAGYNSGLGEVVLKIPCPYWAHLLWKLCYRTKFWDRRVFPIPTR